MRWVQSLLVLLAGACLLPVSACMAGTRVRVINIKGTDFLEMRDVARHYGLSGRMSATSCDLKGGGHVLHFERDKREAKIDGVSVHLSNSPVVWQDGIVLGESDVRLGLDPILRPATVPRGVVRRIMLDPGHGGKDQGTSGRQYAERNLCLRIAKKMADDLRQAGYEVYMTRTTNTTTLELEQRIVYAARNKCDLFVSLHMNSASNRLVNGVETFLVAPNGTASTYDSRVWRGTKRGTQFDLANIRLAYDLHRSLLLATGAKDRGIKHANFLVLRDAPCPAILVEVGFLSNGGEELRLGTPAYQDKAAQGLTKGIVEYAKNIAPATGTPVVMEKRK